MFCRELIVDYGPGFSFSGCVATLVHRFGIVDAVMKDTSEFPVETSGYFVKVLECQFALIQLSVGKDTINDILHHTLDTVWCRVDQCS